MQPLAFLVLSNLPGQNRLKNLKYYLGLGDNVLGSDSRCQIILPSKYEMLNYALNIRVGYNFITLEALHSHLVYVQANLLKKSGRENNTDNYFPLGQNVQYLPRIGEFFYIGRMKAIVGSSSKQELWQIKNIVNRELFKLEVSQRSNISADVSEITQQIQAEKPEQMLNKENQKEFRQEIQRVQVLHLFQNVTLQQNIPYFTTNNQEIHKSQIALKTSNQQKILQFHPDQIVLKEPAEPSEKSKTQQLEQQENQVDPTLVLEDGMYGNEPTINLDQPLLINYEQNEKNLLNIPQNSAQKSQYINQVQKKQLVYSQQVLMNQIRNQQKYQNQQIPHQQIDFSMPDTIVDKQPEQNHRTQVRPNLTIIRPVQSNKKQDQQDQFDMPPTIQQDSVPSKIIQQTKSLVQDPQIQQKQYKLYRRDPLSIEREYVFSPERQKDIQSFDDLFGFTQKSQIKPSNPLKEEPNEEKTEENPVEAESSNNIKLSRSSSRKSSRAKKMTISSNKLKRKKKSLKSQQNQQQETEVKIENMVNLAGLKPTAAHIKYLKEQGFKIVTNPNNDYGLLLVKQPLKLCNKIILALLNAKRIENEQWIFNKDSVIQAKINGLAWKQIYEKKGTHGQPLKGKGRFYISKRLNDLFDGVVQKLGGQVVAQLIDKRRVLNIVLKADDNQDTQLYLNNRQNKKWRFLKSEILLDCVLTGRYSLEDKYIIDLFKDQK